MAATLVADVPNAPTTSTHTKSDFAKWTIQADFLAWYASEDIASIWADIITIGNNTSSWGAPSFSFNWDYGFRLGIGSHLPHDGWDSTISWTYFRTNAKHTLSFQPDNILQPEFFAGFLSGDTPQCMSAKWGLLLNMFDWELGCSYWICKHISLHPFLGIKGGWINQSILTLYSNLTINKILTNKTGQERLKNNFWGLGPSGGVNTTWRICNFHSNFFNFFGDFSLATLWGVWKCSDKYKNSANYTSSVNTKNSSLGGLMLRAFAGIGWNVDFRKGKSHFAAKVGFETQLWIDQLRIATFQLQRLHDDLSLQGITCNCRFDF